MKSRILIYRLSKKKLTFVWGAVALFNFELQLKVGGVLKSSGSQLSNAYNSFSIALKIPEIFEFKVAYPPLETEKMTIICALS